MSFSYYTDVMLAGIIKMVHNFVSEFQIWLKYTAITLKKCLYKVTPCQILHKVSLMGLKMLSEKLICSIKHFNYE